MNYSYKTLKKDAAVSSSNSLSGSQNSRSGSRIISSVSEFLRYINEIIKSDAAKESKFLFRGQENERWKVETSAYRRLKAESIQEEISEEDELYYNLGLIEEYKHADFHSSDLSEIMEKDLGILAQLQHQGAATSLIDFSDNPLVALWFACKKNMKLDSNNGKVFILSTGDESKFKEIDNFRQIKNYNSILNNEKFFYWKPPHLNNRITTQLPYFLIGKRELPLMQEIIITGDLKNNILQELSLVYGIKETTLFPDSTGFAQANSVYSPYGEEKEWVRNRIIMRRLAKNKKESSPDSSTYYNSGNAKYQLKNYRGAIDDFNKVIMIDPQNANAYYNRGDVKYQLKDYKGAIDDLTEAININPDYTNAYINRSDVKYTFKDYRGAIDDLTAAINIEPNNAIFYYKRGSIKYKLQEYQNAIKDLNKAIEIDPNNGEFYTGRGNAKFELEDYQSAIADFNKVLELYKNKNLIDEEKIEALMIARDMLRGLQSKALNSK